MPRRLTHYLRMGTHAEQDYISRGKTLYDALIFNANLVEGSRSALAVLTTRLQKRYLIDPVTYAFALDPRLLQSAGGKGGRGKRSFVALAEKYGLDPKAVGFRRLTPADLETAMAVETFAERVMEYQRTAFAEALEDDAAFLTSDVGDRARWLGPAAVIPPYFVEDFGGGWAGVNERILSSASVGARENRMVMISADSRLATPHNLNEMALRIADTDASASLVWLTDFDEHRARTGELKAYADLVEALAGQGKQPVASYGGYFSVLLAFRGMAGSSHGIGYGDKRNLEPVVGGGLPPARYYLPASRDFVAIADLSLLAAEMSPEEFRTRICDCTICTGLLSQGGTEELLRQYTETEDRQNVSGRIVAVPTARVYRMTRFHYMSVRAAEFEYVRTVDSLETCLRNLGDGMSWVQSILGWAPVAHVPRWIEALTTTA